MLGKPALPSVSGLDLEAVDEIDHVLEVATRSESEAAPGDCDDQTGLGAADQPEVALLGDEAAAGEVIDQRPVDRRASRTGSP
jgi:hypothetical protein